MPSPKNKPAAVCFDLHTVSWFCRKCAFITATQQNTTVEWVNYEDSRVLNAIYTVLFWKGKPGTVEVIQDTTAIGTETDNWHLHFLMTWLQRLFRLGPAAGQAYLDGLERVYQRSRVGLDTMFQDAARINRDVAAAAGEAVRELALIKAASSVTVAGLGAAGAITLVGGAAVLSSAVSMGYGVTTSLIRHAGHSGAAQAVAIQVGKGAAGETLTHVAKHQQLEALTRATKADHIVRSAEGQIRKYSQWVGQQGMSRSRLRKARNIVARSRVQAAAAEEAAARGRTAAKFAGRAAVAVPIIFAAWDIIEAIQEYNETVEGT